MNYRSIHDAVRSGDVLQVEFMVKNGAGINEVESETKFTPMHCACYMGALEVNLITWCRFFLKNNKKQTQLVVRPT